MKKSILILFQTILVYFGLSAQQVIQLYSGKAPGSEAWTWSEQTNSKNMFNTEVTYNVSQPTLTAYLPSKENAIGTSIIIAPGGAFHTLSINSEGVDVARWLNSKGIAAFVLKYRVVRSITDDPVKELMAKMGDFKKLDEENAPIVPLATQDGLTAVKYVRDHAKELNIDPKRIGFIGFSAGGTLTMSVVYTATDENRPNFVAPIYAYEPAILGNIIPKVKTPIFVAVAGDDQLGMMPMSISLYKKWYDAKQPAELHIFERGGHGFGMRKQGLPSDTWYERFGDWMKMQGLMPPPTTTANPFQRRPSPNDTLKSFQLLADGKVRFSIFAPEAKAVTVSGDFPNGFPGISLQKDFSGVWSGVTNSSVSPEWYTYDFFLDGIKTLDPQNNQYKTSANGFSNMMLIDGVETEKFKLKNIPHGRVQSIEYYSNSLKINRRMHVYLPPNYDGKAKLPVLYLLHGGGDSDASWPTAGRANVILDNLYSENKLKPMMVVMPNGHTPLVGFAMGAGPDQDPFCKDLIQDIIPYVEKNFKVISKKEGRAIAGLSMGGIQTLNIALWYPDKFNYAYPMSTGYFPPAIKEIEENYSSILKNPDLNKFKLFTIGMGKDDPLAFNNNKATMSLLDKFGIKHQYRETTGGHTYLVWRENLAYFAPLLFK